MGQYNPLLSSDTVNRQFFEVGGCQYHIHLATLRGAHDLDAKPGRQARRVLNRFIELHHEVDITAFGSVIKAGAEEPDDGAFAENLGSGRLDGIDFVLIQTHSSALEDLIESGGGEDPSNPGIQLFVTGLFQALIDPGGKLAELQLDLFA